MEKPVGTNPRTAWAEPRGGNVSAPVIGAAQPGRATGGGKGGPRVLQVGPRGARELPAALFAGVAVQCGADADRRGFAPLRMPLGGIAVVAMVLQAAVSYTHLTLPTHREV